MTPRSPLARLARAQDFQAIYREGARHATTHLVVYARRNAAGTVRLGVAVGRRFGRATARNRLRRRLREATRGLATRIESGADIVLVPRAGASEISFQGLRASIEAGLAAVKVLSGEAGTR